MPARALSFAMTEESQANLVLDALCLTHNKYTVKMSISMAALSEEEFQAFRM